MSDAKFLIIVVGASFITLMVTLGTTCQQYVMYDGFVQQDLNICQNDRVYYRNQLRDLEAKLRTEAPAP
jgi:hypothetical protein